MELANQVQTQLKAVCISFSANAFEKGMNQFSPTYGFFSFA